MIFALGGNSTVLQQQQQQELWIRNMNNMKSMKADLKYQTKQWKQWPHMDKYSESPDQSETWVATATFPSIQKQGP